MSEDPTGKRALFGPKASGAHPAEGKRALFEAGGTTGGAVRIQCARCGQETRVSVVKAMSLLARVSLWIPGRQYSRRVRCPACHKRSWVRMTLG